MYLKGISNFTISNELNGIPKYTCWINHLSYMKAMFYSITIFKSYLFLKIFIIFNFKHISSKLVVAVSAYRLGWFAFFYSYYYHFKTVWLFPTPLTPIHANSLL